MKTLEARRDVKFLMDYIYDNIYRTNQLEKETGNDLCRLKPGIFYRVKFMDIRKRHGIEGKGYAMGGKSK